MIEELESTEVGVDGVPSMNLEEDKDNERKLKEERLIESMEDQLYKVRSVNSSPSKQHSPTEAKKSSIPSPLSSPSKHNSKRERDEEIKKRVSISVASSSLASIRRRSESLPPQLKKGTEIHDESSFSKMPYNSYSSQISDPSGMYSHELSAIKPELRSSEELFKVPSFNTDENKPTFGGGIKRDQPYSSSLENLDPSAKEFLVDAGIILNNVSPSTGNSKIEDSAMLPSATSLPNISKIDNYQTRTNENWLFDQKLDMNPTEKNIANIGETTSIEKLTSSGSIHGTKSKLDGQQEGDLTKYLISNEEMKRYEAEYQKASIALKAADAMSLQSLASILNESSLQTTSQNNVLDTSTNSVNPMVRNGPNNFTPVSQFAQDNAATNTRHFQTMGTNNSIPNSINKNVNNDFGPNNQGTEKTNAAVTKGSSAHLESNIVPNHSLPNVERNLNGSQPQFPEPSIHTTGQDNSKATESDAIDELINDSVMEAHNMLTNFASAFTTNKIQDSIGKFADQIESTTKNLVAATTSSSTNVTDSVNENMIERNENLTNFEVASKHHRASVMEQKLQAIKQQGIPKKRSLLKPPGALTTPTKQIAYPNAHKRFSLTDQMSAAVVGKHAMQRLMQTPRKQQPPSYTQPIISSPEATSFSSESSEEKSCESSGGNSDQDSDDPRIIHKLKQVRRLASLDETLMTNNHVQHNIPRQPQNRSEIKKHLPAPPQTTVASREYSYAQAERENIDMATYVPPLPNAGTMGTNVNDVFYSGRDSQRTNNTTLVVKPIDGRLSTEFGNRQAMPSSVRPGSKVSGMIQQPTYNQSTSRALPQLPKPSFTGNAQQVQEPSVKRMNKVPLENQALPRGRSTSDSMLNSEDTRQFPQHYQKQSQMVHEGKIIQQPQTYKINQRNSLANLYQQQREKPNQPSQVNSGQTSIKDNVKGKQNYSEINHENEEQGSPATSSRLSGTYRAPPPYPFSPPPPPSQSLRKPSGENMANFSQEPNQRSIGVVSSADSRPNSMEYRQPQVINSPSRFTKVPPPKYRPHQPPSAQKKSSNDGIQPRSLSAVPMNHTPEIGVPSRSSFGGVPSYSGHPAKQTQTRNLKPNGRYGKSLSAESIIFTERMNGEETEFIEIPDGNSHQYINTDNRPQILRSQHPTSRPQSLGSQGSIAVSKQRMLPQTRTVHMRSETPLPMQPNRKSIGIPNRSTQQSQYKIESEEVNSNMKQVRPMYQAGQQGKLQPTGNVGRPSHPNLNPAREQSQSHPMPATTTTTTTAGGPLRRSSGIRMWQNSNGQKGASTSNMQRSIQQNRLAQQGTPILPRQSSQENMRRSPSPSMQQQRPQQMINMNQAKTRIINNGAVKMNSQQPIQNGDLRNSSNFNPEGGQNIQQPNRSRTVGVTQPSRKMSSSSPASRGIGSPSMLQKGNPNIRRPNSMHNSPGSSRPASPHLNNRQGILQQNPQQIQKRRSYQHPPSTQAELTSKQPYGSTGSLQNIRNQPMGPSSLPVSGKLNRPQSADQSGPRFIHQGAQIFHNSRPTSQQQIRVENSIPLPRRNTPQAQPTDQSGTKVQRNSLTSQHLMATKKPLSQTQQMMQPISNNSASTQPYQPQNNTNHQQQRINKSTAIHSNPPRNNGPSSLPMPGFSSKVSMQRRK